ncbi:OLC1v1030278C1 [Oldenlandia corymbosa var. corymbosa]|uniref:OLC1v1030278C1 n=1 Tax=Oldenlandia corymbosa var. corymbosa TaxID=529605 RepID=A0AAV1CIQ9_OLDCO|nr:OLC1v1030278C1 [Oldenlandia corymbosa var. corymbosa]
MVAEVSRLEAETFQIPDQVENYATENEYTMVVEDTQIKQDVLKREEIKECKKELPKIVIIPFFPGRLRRPIKEEVKPDNVEIPSEENVLVDATQAHDEESVEDAEAEEAMKKALENIDKESVVAIYTCPTYAMFSSLLERLLEPKEEENEKEALESSLEGNEIISVQLGEFSSSNLPCSIFDLLKHEPLSKSNVAINIVDESLEFLTCMFEKSIVKSGHFVLPVTFDVIDLNENSAIKLISLFLGRSFRKTARIKLTNGVKSLGWEIVNLNAKCASQVNLNGSCPFDYVPTIFEK